MIEGIGIDMIEVDRMQRRLSGQNGFKEKIFTPAEISYCDSKGESSAQHYAARFCAKEAFLKAAGEGLHLTYELCDIEIVLNEKGKPSVQLNGNLDSLASRRKWKSIHVSLTHLSSTACAVVIIETNEIA